MQTRWRRWCESNDHHAAATIPADIRAVSAAAPIGSSAAASAKPVDAVLTWCARAAVGRSATATDAAKPCKGARRRVVAPGAASSVIHRHATHIRCVAGAADAALLLLVGQCVDGRLPVHARPARATPSAVGVPV